MATYIVGQIDGRHSPETQGKDPAPTEHRCADCYGPYGLSAIPCPNAPGAVRARAFLATREQINRDKKGKS
ncbi:hypothetical protein [Cryobacterium arcticum]|uniref:Uncharacterized protein n=1 Tax=Cryobacterium arcticum TaxID=670052 RepID=A0A1B1BPQ8_9MICO|nr:hypothetical protein [Cryobacterium arcticum]ANP74516.1 hypothetical protein PA27867_3597 [Cryobacterium arcticum]